METLNSPQAMADMLNAVFRLDKQAEEHVVMAALNAKGRVLGVLEISHGTVNASICEPRDIYTRALLCGACSVVVAHNHPSGDASPSRQDIGCHRWVKAAGELIGISLAESIIIGDGACMSFAECGM